MSKTCAKCGGRMEQGFVAVPTSHGNAVTQWVDGVPRKSFWTGLRLKGRRRLSIELWRCQRCGYLESYAPEA